MTAQFNQDIKQDLNKLERSRKGSSSSTPVARPARPVIPAVVGFSPGVDTLTNAGGPSSEGSGLTPPLTMTVDSVKTVTIPVPVGASSIDVDVVQSYTLRDSAGVVLPVTVLNYP